MSNGFDEDTKEWLEQYGEMDLDLADGLYDARLFPPGIEADLNFTPYSDFELAPDFFSFDGSEVPLSSTLVKYSS